MAHRGWLLTPLFILIVGSPVRAQPLDLEDAYYGALELLDGDSRLGSKLFELGWPTDARHQELAQSAGRDGRVALEALLGSGAGVAVSESAYQDARRTRRGDTDAARSAERVLADELKTFARVAGFTGSLDGFDPVFLPYRFSRPQLAGAWDADRPRTWLWKPGKGAPSLGALGFALWAEAELARAELTQVRTVEDAGDDVEQLGSSPAAGFAALVALHVASAQVWELSHELIYDANANKIGPPPGSLGKLNGRELLFPDSWTTSANRGRAEHATNDDTARSRLASQSALLLGLARFARVAGPSAPKELQALFNERQVGGRAVRLFDGDVPLAAMEAALFVFRSLRGLHVSLSGGGRACSLTKVGRGGPDLGNTVTPTDLGLFLMAIEAFLELEAPKGWRNSEIYDDLADEQGKARRLVGPLSGMIRAWQQNQRGFFDSYDVRTSAQAVRTKSLAAQAFAVRGLLASHRVVAKSDPDSPYIRDAREAILWLDETLWNHELDAYVEPSKDQKTPRAPQLGAVATLGALREMALEARDGGCLLRYRQYMASLRANGFVPDTGGADAPVLASVEFAAQGSK